MVKKLALAVVAIVVALTFVEAASRLIARSRGEPTDSGDWQSRRDAVILELASVPVERYAGPELGLQAASGEGLADLLADPAHRSRKAHPYVGFVYDERSNWIPGRRQRGFPSIGADGFFVTRSALSAEAGALRVGVFGGSMAMMMAIQAEDVLRAGLGSIDRFRNRPVVVECLALGGFKQPQQLEALAYFLSLGRRWDIVVNLDGFNEIALPWAENTPAGVPLAFPRAWDVMARALTDSATLRQAAVVVSREDQRRRTARVFSLPLVRWSAAADTLWRRLDSRMEARVGQARQALSQVRAKTEGVPATDERALLDESVALWGDASRAMNGLVRATGGEYFHFLQPNLLDPGSSRKQPRQEELLRQSATPFQRPAELGYPLLAERGELLRVQGIAFFDLRRLFEGRRDVAWIDDCCHTNAAGSEVMATAVVQAMDGAGR